MPGFDYARAKATADRLIERFGKPQASVLRVPTSTGPVYDPTPGAPIDHPCTVVVVNWETRELESGRVQSTDKKVLLARGNLPLDPTPAHKLVIGGVEHVIVGDDVGLGVQTIAPDGETALLYQLQCRR